MEETILIIGASSGIGYSLALEYASKPTTSKIIITARRIPLLELLASEISKVNSKVIVTINKLDITNYDSVFTLFESFSCVVNTVIVNAGIGPRGMIGSKETFYDAEKNTIETNLIGAMAVINASVGHFRLHKGKGGKDGFTLVGISSVAENGGVITASSYSASKVGLKNYLEALSLETWDEDIHVCCLSPGFITTPMSQAMKGIHHFEISSEEGARQMFKMIKAKTRHSFVPCLMPNWVLYRAFKANLDNDPDYKGKLQ